MFYLLFTRVQPVASPSAETYVGMVAGELKARATANRLVGESVMVINAHTTYPAYAVTRFLDGTEQRVLYNQDEPGSIVEDVLVADTIDRADRRETVAALRNTPFWEKHDE